MKTMDGNFNNEEESFNREPSELYHIWTEDESYNWYYTSGDISISFEGNTYEPATLKRSVVQYDVSFETTTLSLEVGRLEDPIMQYMALNPLKITWISVMKIHRNSNPITAMVIFIGQIKNVTFKGPLGKVSCVGFEYVLKQSIPIGKFQKACNHSVFDSNCTLDKTSFETSATVTVSGEGLILTSTSFGAQADDYFTRGFVVFDNGGHIERRMITQHAGNNIKIRFKFIDLISTDSVKAYPGCDQRETTCNDKFSNLDNFQGFIFIPIDNPVTRVP